MLPCADGKSHGVEPSRFSSRYDDDLDEVKEEDHFEDVDELEVSFLAEIFGHCFLNSLI